MSHKLCGCVCARAHACIHINNVIKILEKSHQRVFLVKSTCAHKRKKLCIGMKPEKLLVRCAWGQVMMAKGLQTVLEY